MILIDFNGLAVATVAVNKTDEPDLLRHMILNSLRQHRTAFKKDFGELVICCEGIGNWRKDYFPQYKANRKKYREKSDIDWNEAFRILSEVRDEIKENFPYKVIQVDKCEADDIIGVLCNNTQEFGQYEDVLIISADKDFMQLQKFPNIKQYNPIQKKFYKEDAPKANLLTKILKGDSGDGVPNVMSDDDTFVTEGKRQTKLSQKKIDEIVEDLADGELLYAASWYRNYQRNEKLIDLDQTPEELKVKIISEFNDQQPEKNSSLVFPYLINKNMKMLIESVEEFI